MRSTELRAAGLLSPSRAAAYRAAGDRRTLCRGDRTAMPSARCRSPRRRREPAYTLDAGDKLRIVVFGQDGISNSYIVDAGGNVNLPLIGTVPARGVTTAATVAAIAERLKQGYVREPHVTVEVETYRPFFILGEVTTPGQYPYVANMTVENGDRHCRRLCAARRQEARSSSPATAAASSSSGQVPLNYPLRPGDTIVVKERWF